MTDIENKESKHPGRAPDGTFQKGYIANPGGMPAGFKKKIMELKQQALEKCPEALKRLANHIDLIETLNKTDLGVIKELLDRGMGKPAQQIIVENEVTSEVPFDMSKQEITERLAYLENTLKEN